MSRFAAVALCALVTLQLVVASRAVTLTISNCTDRALCASGCTNYNLPAGQCLQMENGGSQIINCIPTVQVCGDLAYYSDSTCTNLLITDAFVCDRCNRDHNGNFNTLTCLRENGIGYLSASNCSSYCLSCGNAVNVTRGECFPVNTGASAPLWKSVIHTRHAREALQNVQGTVYGKYLGSSTCTGIEVNQWAAGDEACSLWPAQRMSLPEDACINGVKVHCQF